MNWLLITVGMIFLICIIVGVWRGAIRIAVSLATTVLTLVLVFFATPYVAKAITEYTPVDEMIERQVAAAILNAASSQIEEKEESGLTKDGVKKVLEAAGVSEEMLAQYGISVDDIVSGKISGENLAQYGISGDLLNGLKDEGEGGLESVLNSVEVPRDMQVAAIEKADLPEVFKELLSTNNNEEVYKKMGVKTFPEYVGNYLAKLIVNIVAFLCTFLIVTIILRAIVFALDIVSNLPVLGALNRMAGGVIGVIGALVIIWIIFIIITLLYTTSFGKELYQGIQSEPILRMIYEYNPIFKLATKF